MLNFKICLIGRVVTWETFTNSRIEREVPAHTFSKLKCADSSAKQNLMDRELDTHSMKLQHSCCQSDFRLSYVTQVHKH